MDALYELSKTPALLSGLTLHLPETVLKSAPTGKWSIIVHAGHLLTMESLWIARLDDFFMGRPELRPWNGHNRDTEDGRFELQGISQILDDWSALRNAHLNMIRQNLTKTDSMTCFLAVEGREITFGEHLQIMLNHDLAHLEIIRKRLDTFQ